MLNEMWNGLIVHVVEHVLARKVVPVPVVIWSFLDGDLQQREVLASRLGGVRMVVYYNTALSLNFGPIKWDKNLMDSVLPFVTMALMDMVPKKSDALRTIWIPRPYVLIPGAGHVFRKGLKSFAPPWLENFVGVQRDTHVDVIRKQRHRSVTSAIKSPRVYGDMFHVAPRKLGNLDCIVSRPSVHYQSIVSFLTRIGPSLDEVFFVLGNCVNSNFHFVHLVVERYKKLW
jgi:hypothetical protein